MLHMLNLVLRRFRVSKTKNKKITAWQWHCNNKKMSRHSKIGIVALVLIEDLRVLRPIVLLDIVLGC